MRCAVERPEIEGFGAARSERTRLEEGPGLWRSGQNPTVWWRPSSRRRWRVFASSTHGCLTSSLTRALSSLTTLRPPGKFAGGMAMQPPPRPPPPARQARAPRADPVCERDNVRVEASRYEYAMLVCGAACHAPRCRLARLTLDGWIALTMWLPRCTYCHIARSTTATTLMRRAAKAKPSSPGAARTC
jgi:hypothetical protein